MVVSAEIVIAGRTVAGMVLPGIVVAGIVVVYVSSDPNSFAGIAEPMPVPVKGFGSVSVAVFGADIEASLYTFPVTPSLRV